MNFCLRKPILKVVCVSVAISLIVSSVSFAITSTGNSKKCIKPYVVPPQPPGGGCFCRDDIWFDECVPSANSVCDGFASYDVVNGHCVASVPEDECHEGFTTNIKVPSGYYYCPNINCVSNDDCYCEFVRNSGDGTPTPVPTCRS